MAAFKTADLFFGTGLGIEKKSSKVKWRGEQKSDLRSANGFHFSRRVNRHRRHPELGGDLRMAGAQAMKIPPCSRRRATRIDSGVLGDHHPAPQLLDDENFSDFGSCVH
jgi:hypothetical protein